MFSTVCLTTAVINIIFGAVVYLTNPRRRLYQVWLAFSLVTGMWLIGYGFMVAAPTPAQAYFWLKWFHYGFGAIFLPVLYLHFTLALIEKASQHRWTLTVHYLIASGFFLLNIADLFATVLPKPPFNYYTHPHPAYLAYLIWFVFAITQAIVLLISSYRNAVGIRRAQIVYQLVATVVGFSGGITSFFYVFDIPVYPFGVLWNVAYAIIMSYAIARYRLLDIRIAAASTGILILVYTFTLGVPLYLYRSGAHGQALVSMAILGTIGPFLYLFLQRRANETLLKAQRHYQQTLIQASAGMGRIKDLRKLVRLVVRIVMRALKPEHCAIYLYNSSTKNFALGPALFRRESMPLPETIPGDSTLVDYLFQEERPVLLDEIRAYSGIRSSVSASVISLEMSCLRAAMLVPSIIDRRLVAVLVLGPRPSRISYSADDINVFTILANQAALAIENARFYDEVRASQEQLFQAEKLATIGTMADGLAHQINNRFYALSLITEDLQDSIALHRKNPESLPLETLLQQLEVGLKRSLENVTQGGSVVKGLLKYSRHAQTEKEPVNLTRLIEDSLQMVALKVRLADIDVRTDIPPDAATVWGNFVQLQEVLFNIVDNAHFSMMEKKRAQTDFTPTISFVARREDGHVRLLITDNGMGIKAEDQKKLFAPFFTTKVSSRQGNGLGLFVMQKIIQDDHAGKISFASEYTRGVTITILLPLPRPEDPGTPPGNNPTPAARDAVSS